MPQKHFHERLRGVPLVLEVTQLRQGAAERHQVDTRGVDPHGRQDDAVPGQGAFRARQFVLFTRQIQWGYDFSAYWTAAGHLLDGQPIYQAQQLAWT